MAAEEEEQGPVYHEVLASDTFQGICLRYRVSALRLRRANKLFNTNGLTRKRLLIPRSETKTVEGRSSMNADEASVEVTGLPLRRRRCLIREENINLLTTQMSSLIELSYDEARNYLSMSDGDVDRAARHARDDFEPYLTRKGDSTRSYESFEFELSSDYSDDSCSDC
mmetsp:Transcript_18989/g.44480  ORF Transcript_18989/g.44480 Transcript_18989/m.44480 type:complete len:168 (+) Transcript_18989:312-815(+)